MVGPIARLEIGSHGDRRAAQPLEAHMNADRFDELGLKEGEMLLVSPRKARVFLHA